MYLTWDYLVKALFFWKVIWCEVDEIVPQNLLVDLWIHNPGKDANACFAFLGNASPYINLMDE